MMGRMNNDSPLLRVLDGVILEKAIVTFSHFVEMQAVLSLNTYCNETTTADFVRYSVINTISMERKEPIYVPR